MPKNSARRAQLPEKRLKEPRLQQGTGVWQKPPYLKQRHHLLLHPDLLGTTGSRNASSSPHSAASVTLSLPASPLHRNKLIRAVHFLSLCGCGLRLTPQRILVTLNEGSTHFQPTCGTCSLSSPLGHEVFTAGPLCRDHNLPLAAP